MKKLLLLALISLCQLGFSQSKGTVKGIVTDKDMNNEPLAFANVFIKGTTIGTTTEMDGSYSINAPAGNQTIVFSFVGYETIEKSILVKANKVSTLNQAMGGSEGVALDNVTINATVNKEKESALLLEQKKATVIKESIGAVELSKKGVSDAAAAATKVSGVAKQEGSSKVYVRGLGDRYNSTTLNGLPLPSNDPSYKNISLELFPTDMIQSVGVSKSFNSSLSGDVAGANIDIVSKEFSGKGGVTLSVGAGANSQTTLRRFNTIDGANWFGIADYTTPNVVNLNSLPFTDNFTPNYNRVAPLATSLSLSGGNKYLFGEESSFSMYLVGAFGNSYRTRRGMSVNILNKIENAGKLVGYTKGSDYQEAIEYDYGNNKLLMGNFIYKINSNNKISFNSLFIHSNDQKIQQYFGKKPDVADSEGIFAYNVLQTQRQNRLLVNQLLSEHKLGESYDLNLGLSYNLINNDEPNRKKNIFVVNQNENTVKFASGAARNNSRYFHNLGEDDINAVAIIKKYFGKRFDDENKGNVALGYSFRKTKRNFEAIYYDYDLSSPAQVDYNNVDGVLNQSNLNTGVFRVQTGFGFGANALEPFTYNGNKMVHAIFGTFDYKLSEKFLVNVGLRFEKIDMDVAWRTNLTNSNDLLGGPKQLDKNYFLPSLNLKYNFTDDNLIRLSASKTYTYPQFKEIAPFTYEGVDYQETGNPDLIPSDVYNLDIKWEMYPERGELISASLFGKIIQNSINRSEINAASDKFFTYLNTGDSKVYGVEVEMRKKIFTFNEDREENLKLGFNASYMYNNQQFERTNQFDPTNDEEPLEGASPILLNTDLTFSNKIDDKSLSASLVFNYQHTKLYSIGTVNGLESIFQKPQPKLDFIFKRQFSKRLGAKLAVKNILNPSIERYRELPGEPVTRSYRNGINFSLGFSYKL